MAAAVATTPESRSELFGQGVDLLIAADIPFMVGGGYALECHTGIRRMTKDLDVFLLKRDCERALKFFAAHGYQTELTFPHWLGKAIRDGQLIDLIFSSGNGVANVDEEWFEHSIEGEVLGRRVRLCPVEEMIWSKAFIMERERFDGADVAHLLLAAAATLDWKRLCRRFGAHWPLLLTHLIMFGYIYPSERQAIPRSVLDDLFARARREAAPNQLTEPVCQGTLLSREQYLVDVEDWGYADGRLRPRGALTPAAVERWTAAIPEDHRPTSS